MDPVRLFYLDSVLSNFLKISELRDWKKTLVGWLSAEVTRSLGNLGHRGQPTKNRIDAIFALANHASIITDESKPRFQEAIWQRTRNPLKKNKFRGQDDRNGGEFPWSVWGSAESH